MGLEDHITAELNLFISKFFFFNLKTSPRIFKRINETYNSGTLKLQEALR